MALYTFYYTILAPDSCAEDRRVKAIAFYWLVLIESSGRMLFPQGPLVESPVLDYAVLWLTLRKRPIHPLLAEMSTVLLLLMLCRLPSVAYLPTRKGLHPTFLGKTTVSFPSFPPKCSRLSSHA